MQNQFIEKKEDSGTGFALAMMLIGIFFIWVASQVFHSPHTAEWSGLVRVISILAVIVYFCPISWIFGWAIVRLMKNYERYEQKSLLPYQLSRPVNFVVKEYVPKT